MGGSLDEVLVVSEPGADSDDGARDQSGRVSPEYKTDKMAIYCPVLKINNHATGGWRTKDILGGPKSLETKKLGSSKG